MIYLSQHTKASKEHRWFPWNKDSLVLHVRLRDKSIDSREWYLSSISNLPLDLWKIQNLFSSIDFSFTNILPMPPRHDMPRRIPTDNYHMPKNKHSRMTSTLKTHITTKTQHDNNVERNRLDHGENTKCGKRIHTSVIHTTKTQQARRQQQCR